MPIVWVMHIYGQMTVGEGTRKQIATKHPINKIDIAWGWVVS